MLLYHDGVLPAVHRLLSGNDHGVLRPGARDYLCGRSDHDLLCPGHNHCVLRASANDDLLCAENSLLFCGTDDGLLPGAIHLSGLLLVLSTLVVAVIANRSFAALKTLSNLKWIAPAMQTAIVRDCSCGSRREKRVAR
jgi:hypothetical protein